MTRKKVRRSPFNCLLYLGFNKGGLSRAVIPIHRTAQKGPSRKPLYIRPHTYPVPGRRQAELRLFSESSRRVLLGNRASGIRGSQQSVCRMLPLLLYLATKFPRRQAQRRIR